PLVQEIEAKSSHEIILSVLRGRFGAVPEEIAARLGNILDKKSSASWPSSQGSARTSRLFARNSRVERSKTFERVSSHGRRAYLADLGGGSDSYSRCFRSWFFPAGGFREVALRPGGRRPPAEGRGVFRILL